MSDLRQYPEGRGSVQVKYILGVEVAYGVAKTVRQRVLTADVNAGLVLTAMPALPAVRWRLLDFYLIAIGGAASGATDVRVLGTRAASSVALGVAAVAGLTQSTLIRAGSAAVVILADGASFTQLDVNTPVTVGKTGGSLATSTAVDFVIDYVADPA